jgi:hypothetical protein
MAALKISLTLTLFIWYNYKQYKLLGNRRFGKENASVQELFLWPQQGSMVTNTFRRVSLPPEQKNKSRQKPKPLWTLDFYLSFTDEIKKGMRAMKSMGGV